MKQLLRISCVSVVVWAGGLTYGAYVGDFESPVFSSGVINGQDSWTTPTNDFTARIQTSQEIATQLSNAGITPGVPVHGGEQALFVSGTGGSSATIRQIGGMETEQFVQLDVWARPLTAGNTGAPIGNIFLTMEDNAGERAAAFRFGFVGGVPTIDYGTNITGVWQSTGVTWEDQSWYRLTLTVDYFSKTYNFALNGTQLNFDPIPFYNPASDAFSQVRIFRGSNQAGMIVDDFSVMPVPEPTSFAMLGCGLGALLLRRRARTAAV